MRRSSAVFRGAPPLEPIDEVILRSKIPGPALGPGFMRRSCTFVTEGTWRKSTGFGIGTKETKDRVNLARQVRKKVSELGSVNGDETPGADRPGRVSRLVGNLKSWSSSEDVRHSVVGAFTRTVNVIKNGPSSKKTKPQGLTSQFITPQPSKPPNSTSSNTKNKKRIVKNASQTNSTAPSVQKSTKAPNNKTATTPKKRIPQSAQPDRIKPAGRNHPSKEVKEPWIRHLHEAQANFNAKEGRHRRSQPQQNLPEPDDSGSPANHITDIDDGVDGEASESADVSVESSGGARLKQEPTELGSPSGAVSSPESVVKKTDAGAGPATSQAQQTTSGAGSPGTVPRRRLQEVQIIQIVEGPPLISPSEVIVSQGVVLSAEPVLSPIELLRRKDQKIREALVEKQNLVADILNIPRCDLESVADVAGEAGVVHKEPKELVLAAVFQAKRLQETLNEAQVVTESMVMASRASPDAQPAYRTPFETMQKLLGISSSLNQFLNSLMTIVSERDEERDRMRKELVNSRERLHQLHRNMTQQPSDPDPSGPTEQESSETKVPLAADPCQRVASPSIATARPVTPTPDKAASVSADEEGGKDPVVPVAAPLQSSSDTPLTDKEKRKTGADDGDAATPLLETAEGSSAAGGDEPSGATHPEAETKEAVVTS